VATLPGYFGTGDSRAYNYKGVGDEGRQGKVLPPQKKIGKIYFGQLCKILAYSGKNQVRFGNFVNFSVKYNKNSGILLIFRARIM